MSTNLDRFKERMRQSREQRAAELVGPRTGPPRAGLVRELPHPVGTVVFDPVTGQEGVVVSGGVQNVVVPTAQR